MGYSRRKFMKTVWPAFAGLMGLTVLPKASFAGSSGTAPVAEQARDIAIAGNKAALKAGRWGMVLFTKKINRIAAFYNIIQACHKAHNVPDIDGQYAVKWIWSASFSRSFSIEQRSESLLNRRFLLLCNHCANPPCVRVCPSKASFKRADGLVLINYDLCIGCRACMAACPYEARSFNFFDPALHIKEVVQGVPVRERGVVEKCNFCVERLEAGMLPHCVEASAGAIIAGDLADPLSEVSSALKNNYGLSRKLALGLGPNVYYIL
jgi:molybdopterin-containing oxidoreductase family iron-sulfur binding subunit